MNDLEMELQTIRQKLQTLKASPPETIAAPWGQSRQAPPSPDFIQVKTAIETLRQRSEQPHTITAPSPPNLQQFEQLLATIDKLALQQQQALQQLHTVGNSLMGEVPPGTSPEIDDIARFLNECPAIDIPAVERTNQGYLDMAFRTVDFRQAEYDATSNAATLRTYSRLFQHPLSSNQGHPNNYANSNYGEDNFYESNGISNFIDDVKNFLHIAVRAIRRWANRRFTASQRSRSQFNLLDGAIWCLGAAIMRIVLNQVFQFYPGLWTPIALIVIVGIVLSLYSSFFSPKPNPAMGYRTLMVIIGLILGGKFSP